MAFGAYSPSLWSNYRPRHIYLMGDGLKVFWVHADMETTQMVQLQACGYFPLQQSVYNSVRALHPSLVTNKPILPLVYRAHP